MSGTNADELHINCQSDRGVVICQVLLIIGFGNGPQRNIALPSLSGMTLLHRLKKLKDLVSIKTTSREVSTHFHRIGQILQEAVQHITGFKEVVNRKHTGGHIGTLSERSR